MTTIKATTIQEIRGGAVTGASRRQRRAAARQGTGALADVCQGLFGVPAGQQTRPSGRMLDDTVEIVISAKGRPAMASAA